MFECLEIISKQNRRKNKTKYPSEVSNHCFGLAMARDVIEELSCKRELRCAVLR